MTLETRYNYTLETATTLIPTDWTEESAINLRCNSLTRLTGPRVDTAELVWEFGHLTRIGTESEQTYVAPRSDLVGKFVRIRIENGPLAADLRWTGYILAESIERWSQQDDGAGAQRLRGGTQTFTVVGLEWFLEQKQVVGTSSLMADRQKRQVPYNGGAGDGRSADTSKRGNKASDSLAFDFSSSSVEWTATEICQHLLSNHAPRNHDNATRPVAYELHWTGEPYLQWYKPTLAVEGRSLLDILGELIPENRGLVFWFENYYDVQGFEEEEVVLRLFVSSAAGASIHLPNGQTLLAARRIQANFQPDTIGSANPIKLAQPEGRYDFVRVWGARRTSTFTVKGADVDGTADRSYDFGNYPIKSTFAGNWSITPQQAYTIGVRDTYADYASLEDAEKADRNDIYRRRSRFERVFRHFEFTIVGGTDAPLSPIIQQDTQSITGDIAPTSPDVLRMLRTTMLRASSTYEDATAPVAEEETEELRPPFAMVYLPRATGAAFIPTTLGQFTPGAPATTTDGGFRFAHDLGKTKEVGFDTAHAGDAPNLERKYSFNIGLTPQSAGPGFVLDVRGGMPHTIGGVIDGFEPSRHARELQYHSLLVTITCEWDAYCEGTYPNAVPNPAEPVRELLIRIGDRARFDWLAKGTIYDIGEDGHPLQVQTGGALRDDRILCQSIAQLAHEWYSTPRRGFAISFGTLVHPFDGNAYQSGGLGTLIQNVGTGAAAIECNAVITTLTYNLQDDKLTAHASVSDFDVEAVA